MTRCLFLGGLSFVVPHAAGCDPSPDTSVVLENAYPPSATLPLVVYRAAWQAVSFTSPIPPGSSSGPQPTLPASDNTAYVLLAPGWDPSSPRPPTSFVVLQSRSGFAVPFDGTLTISVDDTTFLGNCGAGSFLSQEQADLITGSVFPSLFTSSLYDAASCTTTLVGYTGPP